MKIRPYQPQDIEGLIDFWTEIFPASSPHNDPATSLDNKLRTDPNLLLVAVIDSQIIGSVMGATMGIAAGSILSASAHPFEDRESHLR